MFNKFVNIIRNIPSGERTAPKISQFKDMETDFFDLYKRCMDFTMLSVERLYALYKATEYISKSNLPGDVVECGTWKGGSAMMIALSLLRHNYLKKIYLYDTFAGMSKPTKKDISLSGKIAIDKWKKLGDKTVNTWCYSPLDEVKHNLYSTGYPRNYLCFVKGKVEQTIPKVCPNKIAILHLDTDWYSSTYHELIHLFPKVVKGGVLIIDDYGHWRGAREAVDKYFSEKKMNLFLNRSDYSGRTAIIP